MKKILLILVFYAAAGSVLAFQDSYIKIDSRNNGLCFASDDTQNSNSVCDNQTLTIEGTSDHVIYILPESVLKPNSTAQEHMSYALFTPLNLLFVLGFFGFTAGLIVVAVMFFARLFGMFKNHG